MTQLSLLPPPNLAKLLNGIKVTKTLLEFCCVAEKHIGKPWKKPKCIPKKFYGSPRNAVISSLQSELSTAIYFFDHAHHTTESEHRIPHYREQVVRTIKLIRTEAWEQHVNEEYEEAFTRFEDGCVAFHLGHSPGPSDLRVFTLKEVERAFERCKNSQHGVVMLRHVYDVLCSRATQ